MNQSSVESVGDGWPLCGEAAHAPANVEHPGLLSLQVSRNREGQGCAARLSHHAWRCAHCWSATLLHVPHRELPRGAFDFSAVPRSTRLLELHSVGCQTQPTPRECEVTGVRSRGAEFAPCCAVSWRCAHVGDVTPRSLDGSQHVGDRSSEKCESAGTDKALLTVAALLPRVVCTSTWKQFKRNTFSWSESGGITREVSMACPDCFHPSLLRQSRLKTLEDCMRIWPMTG